MVRRWLAVDLTLPSHPLRAVLPASDVHTLCLDFATKKSNTRTCSTRGFIQFKFSSSSYQWNYSQSVQPIDVIRVNGQLTGYRLPSEFLQYHQTCAAWLYYWTSCYRVQANWSFSSNPLKSPRSKIMQSRGLVTHNLHSNPQSTGRFCSYPTFRIPIPLYARWPVHDLINLGRPWLGESDFGLIEIGFPISLQRCETLQ